MTGAQRQTVLRALEAAFPSRDRLEALLDGLDKSLGRYAAESVPLETAVFKVVAGARAEGWLPRLLAEAAVVNPGNPQLAEVMRQYQLTRPVTRPGGNLGAASSRTHGGQALRPFAPARAPASPPTPLAGPPSDEDVITTLANEFPVPNVAQGLVGRAGLPAGRQPSWNVSNAESYWRAVRDLFAGGAVEGGWADLLHAAYDARPGNAVLAAAAKAAGVAGAPAPRTDHRRTSPPPAGPLIPAAGRIVRIDGPGTQGPAVKAEVQLPNTERRSDPPPTGPLAPATDEAQPPQVPTRAVDEPRRRRRRRTVLVAAPIAVVVIVLIASLADRCSSEHPYGTPAGVAVAADGTVYFTDTHHDRVKKIDKAGVVSDFAGTGVSTFSGDGGPAIRAQVGFPNGVAVTDDGTVYIDDNHNDRIRKIDPSGTIRTIAGIGTGDGHGTFSGDNSAATKAGLNSPQGIAVTSDGTVYIADTANNRVRKIDPSSGTITTVAGTGASTGSVSDDDGGLATQADLSAPADVAVGPGGALYIVDTGHDRIRKVDAQGRITTVAGTGEPGLAGDGRLAVETQLDNPLGVAVAADGTLYIAEYHGNHIRKVDPSGKISTFAGTGDWGFSGDGGLAAEAKLNGPVGVDVGPDGSLYIAIFDGEAPRLRKVDPAGRISTLT
ncbi:effector-associated domain EAD1-containing protein [Pseudofrankia saprophytica]|uniref:NHL domain-containing protein n=1 Tax=Pseudofrankia saprophytica TaxID=298655 RepID=UPI0002E64EB1|nr:effector-associated domain EAD1-containing protein [Pseudofrankia saprophytica]